MPPGFQLQVSGALPFTGMTGNGADRALNFAGQIHAAGSGALGGRTVSMEFPAQATITVDAASGLMRSSITEGTLTLKLNGVTQMEMHMRQSETCAITTAA